MEFALNHRNLFNTIIHLTLLLLEQIALIAPLQRLFLLSQILESSRTNTEPLCKFAKSILLPELQLVHAYKILITIKVLEMYLHTLILIQNC